MGVAKLGRYYYPIKLTLCAGWGDLPQPQTPPLPPEPVHYLGLVIAIFPFCTGDRHASSAICISSLNSCKLDKFL